MVVMRLWSYRAAAPTAAEDNPETLELKRYAPAARLLSADDFAFIAGQPGYQSKIGRKMRKTRRRIFRMYVRKLASDYYRIHALARRMAANSPEANSVLVGKLVRQHISFWRAILLIEIRMLTPGIPDINLAPLVESIEAMRVDLIGPAAHAA